MIALITSAVTLIMGCSVTKEDLTPPNVLIAPYDTSHGDVLWAVAPLSNESGTSLVDGFEIADALVARITESRGLVGVSVNRTAAAMAALGIESIDSMADARAVVEALGVDALLVGTVTAYDPYDPPKLGLTVALHARDGRLQDPASWLDPLALEMAYTDQGHLPNLSNAAGPMVVIADHLDAANHEVQTNVMRYATGRHDYDSALGWRRYMASMDLYTDFAAYWTVHRILESERLRLSRLVRGVEQAAR